jgi:GH25 family lysozyme M1 (1,4-beta-N-acetylmuramidase)
MKTYQLLIDTWEGQLDVDEAVLKANGVAGMLIRLNDMNGGHHKDATFDVQWKQANGFIRAPYFVYNPWVTGQKNFDWLKANMPADARAVMVDMEVRKEGYSPVTYAAEFEAFKKLSKGHWRTVIYVGEWFLKYLSKWPSDVEYWWSQWPYAFYPSDTRSLTWDQLRVELEPFTGPLNAGRCPGTIRMWQFTGDRLILPGSTKPLDLNVFFGTYDELAEWLGSPQEEPSAPPPPPTPDPVEPETEPTEYFGTVLRGPIIVRTYPQVSEATKTNIRLNVGDVETGRIWAGNGYVWLRIAIGWVAVRMLDGSGQLIKLTVKTTTSSRIVQLRDPFEPIIQDNMGLGTGTEIGSFIHGPLWDEEDGFKDVTTWQVIGKKWFDYMLSLQPVDFLKYGFTRKQKENWLINRTPNTKASRPWFVANGEEVFGHCVVLSQPVRIKTYADGTPIITYFDKVWLADKYVKGVAFVELDGFKPEHAGQPLKWMIDNAYAQYWLALPTATKINYHPRGDIIQLVFSPDVWRTNNRAKRYMPLFYVKGYKIDGTKEQG